MITIIAKAFVVRMCINPACEGGHIKWGDFACDFCHYGFVRRGWTANKAADRKMMQKAANRANAKKAKEAQEDAVFNSLYSKRKEH